MSTLSYANRMTADEFAQTDPQERYDLIRGELTSMPPLPGARHGALTMTLSSYATFFVLENRLGHCFAAETRFIIERNPDTVIGPDWAFVAAERLPQPLPVGFLPLAPDIVLEVRSPSDRERDVQNKVQRWLAAGVGLVWELNPEPRILTVYRPALPAYLLTVDDVLTGEDLLPGFVFPLRRLFPEE